jgi:hypothetical protein
LKALLLLLAAIMLQLLLSSQVKAVSLSPYYH